MVNNIKNHNNSTFHSSVKNCVSKYRNNNYKTQKMVLYAFNRVTQFRNLKIIMFLLKDQLSTLFQLYPGGQFYWWRKPDYPEKTTDLPQVTDKVVSSTPRLSGIWANIGDDRNYLYR